MRRHFSHYVALFGIFGLAIFGFLNFPTDKAFGAALVIATAASYVSWGIVHHWAHRDLYPEVFLEYLAIAVLGGTITLAVLR